MSSRSCEDAPPSPYMCPPLPEVFEESSKHGKRAVSDSGEECLKSEATVAEKFPSVLGIAPFSMQFHLPQPSSHSMKFDNCASTRKCRSQPSLPACRRSTPEQRRRWDLSNLQFIMSGAEPIKVHTMTTFFNTFAECGLKPSVFCSAYGLAEHVCGEPSWRWFVMMNMPA